MHVKTKKSQNNASRWIVLKTVVVCCVIFIMIVLIVTSNFDNSPTSAQLMLRDYMYTSLHKNSVERFANCSNNGNMSRVVLQYREMVNRLATDSIPVLTSDLTKEKDYCMIPETILNDERLQLMVERLKTTRAGCKYPDKELMKPINPITLLDVPNYHLIICRNPKAASSALGVYVNGLFVYNVIDSHMNVLKGLSTHTLLRSHAPQPPNDSKGQLTRYDKLNVVAVRHPFQRAVSGYVNKVAEHAAYIKSQPDLYSEMMKFSKLSPSEAKVYLIGYINKSNKKQINIKHFKCMNEIKTLDEYDFIKEDHSNLVKPTFRGFVLGIVASLLKCKGDPECLWNKEKHYRTQTNKCTPCAAKYDIIIKAETLQEDMAFIEKLLDLPPAWDLHQQIIANNELEVAKLEVAKLRDEGSDESDDVLKANTSNRNKPYEDYMGELTKEEMDMLFTAYYHDFSIFGYDPCAGI